MKKNILIFPLLILLAAGCNRGLSGNFSDSNPKACTLEAKACPDGSFVARTGPNCEFAACSDNKIGTPVPVPAPAPTNTQTSGIEGVITIGPSCPVQRIPPDPQCDDKPYQATVIVKSADGKTEITRFTSDTQGKFKVSLDAGTYSLEPQGGRIYPSASSQQVIVAKNKFTQVSIVYDSGIR